MAGRISCCLNLPPLINSSSPLKITSQIRCVSKRRREEVSESQPRGSKSSLFLRIAVSAVIVTFQISDVDSVESAALESPVKEVRRRWSDKRTCPPWLQNSFETIVPENLPRPSGHRRWELAGFAKEDAPPLGAVVTRANRACFSM